MDENILGLVAGGITSVAMLPQLIKVLKEKDVKDLSLLMIVVLITGLSLWVWYGFMKDELPIILSNAFAVLVNIALLISYFKFRK
ncbi:MAG TPA: SemiSWEET transporter [Kaistella chaponensis]|jgi:MtN3 and saliva related transmembrane protein|uniref:MtN3 and saliva related transmembrane protein n=1 Tax=Kaistella chaponensis TaxID=713588 RepID=A0A1N7N9Q1_9FLAO|nr:SemiSWEET transporter [Kaistella chaponensis]SIS95084.1 MtN3 and saliva related transmembrane protein [Kaistella chaponensis]HPW89478.1 SemiSWEET transporter [Kaistella chaponensis]HQC06993.1 SemiSWEET transporter [Kaistella chaponensis]